MPVAQERATVVAVMEQSGEFKSELFRVERDGFVQIPGDHAGMLQIGGEGGHGFGHDDLLCIG